MQRQLVSVLEQQLNESDSSLFEVGEQRERNHRYVTMQPLGNEKRGKSNYISPDVIDATENKKSLFSETFFSNRQTVKFKQGGMGVPGEADAKTAYTQRVFRRNKMHQLFRDGWHDAFVAKRMVVLVTWRNDEKEFDIEVNGATGPQLSQIIRQNVGAKELLELDMSNMVQQGPFVSGTAVAVVDDSHVELTLCQPERYHRDPYATYAEDGQWNTYEEDIARSQLIDEGYDEEQIRGLALDYRWRSNEEDRARKAHDQSHTHRQRSAREEVQENVTRYRTWTYLDLTDEQYAGEDLQLAFQPRPGIRLYEIHWTKSEILRASEGNHWIKEAEEMPFFEWTEMKISHADNGMCTADVMAHTQKTNSVLKRLVIDSQQQRNNPRLEAKTNAVKNKRDLMEGAIGSIIWTRETGAVKALEAPDISPATMSVLQMLREDGERRDGYTGLGKGTNTDAIRYQNADSMIERLTTAGTRRPMSAARDWANTFLVPVSQYICRLAMRFDRSQTQEEVGGRLVVVAPQQWQDYDCDMQSAVALTPQELAEYAQKMFTMHTVMKDDEDLSAMYGPRQKHALFDAIFDAMGVSDSTPYLMRPDSPEYMQVMQQRQQQQQVAMQMQTQAAQLQFGLAQSADEREWARLNWSKTQDMNSNSLDWSRFDVERADKQSKSQLGWAEHEHAVDIDHQELRLERSQRRAVSVG